MIRIGLIGCGFMGGMHSACYNAIEGAKVVAVADVREEKAKEVADLHGAKIYANGMDLIANADVDAVDICLPTYLHTEHAVAAMKKGRNVFIEKPVLLTKKEEELLLNTQAETSVKVQVGQVIRFWDEYVWLKGTYDSGVYGKVKSASFKRLSSTPTWAWDNWHHTPEKSGTVALDMHVHDVDYVRYLMGDPDSFVSREVRGSNGAIEQIYTLFTYGDATVSVEACWDFPADFPFTAHFCVKFEKATVVLDGNGLCVYPVEGGKIKPDLKPAFELDNNIGGNISDLGGYYNELKYFVEKLDANEELEVAPLDEGIKSALLALSEIESVGGVQK